MAPHISNTNAGDEDIFLTWTKFLLVVSTSLVSGPPFLHNGAIHWSTFLTLSK